jgi:hypothetical protein
MDYEIHRERSRNMGWQKAASTADSIMPSSYLYGAIAKYWKPERDWTNQKYSSE